MLKALQIILLPENCDEGQHSCTGHIYLQVPALGKNGAVRVTTPLSGHYSDVSLQIHGHIMLAIIWNFHFAIWQTVTHSIWNSDNYVFMLAIFVCKTNVVTWQCVVTFLLSTRHIPLWLTTNLILNNISYISRRYMIPSTVWFPFRCKMYQVIQSQIEHDQSIQTRPRTARSPLMYPVHSLTDSRRSRRVHFLYGSSDWTRTR